MGSFENNSDDNIIKDWIPYYSTTSKMCLAVVESFPNWFHTPKVFDKRRKNNILDFALYTSQLVLLPSATLNVTSVIGANSGDLPHFNSFQSITNK